LKLESLPAINVVPAGTMNDGVLALLVGSGDAGVEIPWRNAARYNIAKRTQGVCRHRRH
jgi:hypothetical protein